MTFALLRLLPRVTEARPGAAARASRSWRPLSRLIARFVPELPRRDDRHPFSHDGRTASSVAGIPPLLPMPVAAVGRRTPLSYDLIRELLPGRVRDRDARRDRIADVRGRRRRHDRHASTIPNSELIALGIGNIVAPFFGGIAATGALARTATNIRAGARSPFAAVMHALFVLAACSRWRRWSPTCRWRRWPRC